MTYKHEQTKPVLRRRNSIRTYKVLDIKEGNLIVRNPYKREKTEEILVPKLENDYKVGDYADIIFCKMGSSSYKTELIGHTPPEFVSTNGEDIV